MVGNPLAIHTNRAVWELLGGGGLKILQTIKSVHHVDDEIIKKGGCQNVSKLTSQGSKIPAGPPPPREFYATEASCRKTPGLDQP